MREWSSEGVSDDQIYAIITDPKWAISESVIDGSNGPGDGYAVRQIERGREFAIDPMLAELNDEYPCAGIVGPRDPVDWSDALTAWITFYHLTMYRDSQILEVVSVMNSAAGTKAFEMVMPAEVASRVLPQRDSGVG